MAAAGAGWPGKLAAPSPRWWAGPYYSGWVLYCTGVVSAIPIITVELPSYRDLLKGVGLPQPTAGIDHILKNLKLEGQGVRHVRGQYVGVPVSLHDVGHVA